MTIEEALTYTENYIRRYENQLENRQEITAHDKFNLAYADIVKTALEKQKAKKIIEGRKCPCCGWVMPDSAVFLKTRCWNCGQAIDWKEESNE